MEWRYFHVALVIVLVVLVSGCTSDSSSIVPDASSFTKNLSFTGFDGKAAADLPAGHWLTQYYGAIVPAGGTSPYRCVMIQSSIPGNVGFADNSCILSGDIPEQPEGTMKGVYPFSFNIYDSQGNKAGPFQLSLTITSQPPTLNIQSINTAYAGYDYNYSICIPASNNQLNCGQDPTATHPYGGVPPYTFTASGLPLGLTMKANGLISGTIPENALTKKYDVTICATDNTGTETCADTTLDVRRLLKYNLTIWWKGSGKGTLTYVTSSNENCSGDDTGYRCIESYDSGTNITITQEPDADSKFNGWSGACSGTGNCTVIIDSDQTVTADFSARLEQWTGTMTGEFDYNPDRQKSSFCDDGVIATTVHLDFSYKGELAATVASGSWDSGQLGVGTASSETTVVREGTPEYDSEGKCWCQSKVANVDNVPLNVGVHEGAPGKPSLIAVSSGLTNTQLISLEMEFWCSSDSNPYVPGEYNYGFYLVPTSSVIANSTSISGTWKSSNDWPHGTFTLTKK